MNIDHLRYIAASVRLESFTDAAHELYVTPQTVSKAARDAADHFGHPLFEREGRSVRVTELGQEIGHIAQIAVDDYDRYYDFDADAFRGPESP